MAVIPGHYILNTLRPRQNGRRFSDDIFKCIFLNENVWISNKISMKFVPKGPINNIPALVQIMAWCQPGDKPLSEPMMVSLLTHMYVTRPQWVKSGILYLHKKLINTHIVGEKTSFGMYLASAHHQVLCIRLGYHYVRHSLWLHDMESFSPWLPLGTHRWIPLTSVITVECPHNGSLLRSFDVFFVVSLTAL